MSELGAGQSGSGKVGELRKKAIWLLAAFALMAASLSPASASNDNVPVGERAEVAKQLISELHGQGVFPEGTTFAVEPDGTVIVMGSITGREKGKLNSQLKELNSVVKFVDADIQPDLAYDRQGDDIGGNPNASHYGGAELVYDLPGSGWLTGVGGCTSGFPMYDWISTPQGSAQRGFTTTAYHCGREVTDLGNNVFFWSNDGNESWPGGPTGSWGQLQGASDSWGRSSSWWDTRIVTYQTQYYAGGVPYASPPIGPQDGPRIYQAMGGTAQDFEWATALVVGKQDPIQSGAGNWKADLDDSQTGSATLGMFGTTTGKQGGFYFWADYFWCNPWPGKGNECVWMDAWQRWSDQGGDIGGNSGGPFFYQPDGPLSNEVVAVGTVVGQLTLAGDPNDCTPVYTNPNHGAACDVVITVPISKVEEVTGGQVATTAKLWPDTPLQGLTLWQH